MIYAKLILRNARRSAKDYLIYLVTLIICVTLFYAFLSVSSRSYHPDIGTDYDFSMLSSSMKLMICGITLILLFLIHFVNRYMLRRRQKEFAVLAVMGMEQHTIGWLFFAETMVMGALSIVIGIALGVLCSQFITAMLLSSYGSNYQFTWTLFPDTVLLTVCFFLLSLSVIGIGNIRTIQKTKIITMLYAENQNEPHLKKSRFLPAVTVFYHIMLLWMLFVALMKKHFYYDPRYPFPAQMMFWGNIAIPVIALAWSIVSLIRRKKIKFQTFTAVHCLLALINAAFAASVPSIQHKYRIAGGFQANFQYQVFILADLTFLICGIMYLAGIFLTFYKESSPKHKYRGTNLFFFGQIVSKLQTSSKTMALICLTLVLSIFLFLAAPALGGWASGYLDLRAVYDVQIFTGYNSVYEEEELPQDSYTFVTDFLKERKIPIQSDCTPRLYLPKRADFHSRSKQHFPSVAIALSDYNTLREMLGFAPISLKEQEFTTHWHAAAEDAEKNEILKHASLDTDAGTLTLAAEASHEELMGESLYNSYTAFFYVFPDNVCEKLLAVQKNRYITTKTPLSYEDATELERLFEQTYPYTEDGVDYNIRTRTIQTNSTTAEIFVFQSSMTYGAVVLMVICLTILALQLLYDAPRSHFRFGVLRKMGVDEAERNRLVRRQLALWFGLPVLTAILIAAVLILYFFQSIATQISAYMGFGELLAQIGRIAAILAVLLGCYFVSTWILFQQTSSAE